MDSFLFAPVFEELLADVLDALVGADDRDAALRGQGGACGRDRRVGELSVVRGQARCAGERTRRVHAERGRVSQRLQSIVRDLEPRFSVSVALMIAALETFSLGAEALAIVESV